MKSITIMVLGDETWDGLIDELYSNGYYPLVRSRMHEALKVVAPDRFAAILVDRENTEADPLEFVLNVRDRDAETPILVIGNRRNDKYERHLQSLEGVELVGKDISRLGEHLQLIA